MCLKKLFELLAKRHQKDEKTFLSAGSSSGTVICCGLLSRFNRLRWHEQSSIIVKTQRILGANFCGNQDISSAAASDASNCTHNITGSSMLINILAHILARPKANVQWGRQIHPSFHPFYDLRVTNFSTPPLLDTGRWFNYSTHLNNLKL